MKIEARIIERHGNSRRLCVRVFAATVFRSSVMDEVQLRKMLILKQCLLVGLYYNELIYSSFGHCRLYFRCFSLGATLLCIC